MTHIPKCPGLHDWRHDDARRVSVCVDCGHEVDDRDLKQSMDFRRVGLRAQNGVIAAQAGVPKHERLS